MCLQLTCIIYLYGLLCPHLFVMTHGAIALCLDKISSVFTEITQNCSKNRSIYNHLRTLDLGFCILWHLLVNALLPSFPLGYIVFTCGTAKYIYLYIVYYIFIYCILYIPPIFHGKNSVSQGSESCLQPSSRKSYLYFTCNDLCVRFFVSYGAWKGQMKVLSPEISHMLIKVIFPNFNYWYNALSPFWVSEVLFCFLFQLNIFQVLYLF